MSKKAKAKVVIQPAPRHQNVETIAVGLNPLSALGKMADEKHCTVNGASNGIVVHESRNGKETIGHGLQETAKSFDSQGDFHAVLIDYAKYLYEEELQRSERYHGAMKTYLTFISLTFSATVLIAKWLHVDPALFFSKYAPFAETLLTSFLLLALGFLMASFFLTILVIKVWRTERLCSPKSFAREAAADSDMERLKEKIIANYVIAAETNGGVNDRKGSLLSKASFLYRCGVCCLVCAAVLYLFC
jgi:hypothetical protein